MAAIQMSIICSASEGRETMPVTVGDRDSWLSHRPLRVIRRELTPQPKNEEASREEKGGKKATQTNQNSRPDALPVPTRDQCHKDAQLARQTIPFLSQRPAITSSCFHLPFYEPSPPHQGTGVVS